MTTATADVYDEQGDQLDSLSLQLHDFGGRTAFNGQVRTVRCYRDNALVKSVLATPGAGSVLVVDGGGSLESALIGDLIAASAVVNGWAGVIVHGAIRDREVIATLDIGVKALGSNPRKSAKDGVGEVDVPVVIAGVRFLPGGHVWADADGILSSVDTRPRE
jgi:regulator of ribonuclease activity A